MASKSGLSFSFAKKAEPKRVVEALQTKKDDGRVAVTGLDGGEITVDKVEEAAKLLTIPCKNSLGNRAAARKPADSSAALAKHAPKIDIEQGGLQQMKAPVISAEDAEAIAELKRAAGGGDDGEERAPVAPILMREGSKRARDFAPTNDTSREMYENIPVESFGEALLRGMGYDPTQHKTKPVWNDKPRDTNLGLGAQALLPSEKALIKGKGKGKGAAGAKPTPAKPEKGGTGDAVSAAEVTAAEPVAKQARKEGSPVVAAHDHESRTALPGDMWPSRGLLVRICQRGGEELPGRLPEFIGKDAVVLEASESARTCRIKARLGDRSHVLEGVTPSIIEPVVGAECSRVRVLRGAYRDEELKLIRCSKRREVVIVRKEGAEIELPLRDVCEFIAPKR